MTKMNSLGQHILKSKYYAEDEKTPEDLFKRVSRVNALGDVLDRLLETIQLPIPADLDEYFNPYQKAWNRLLKRRKVDVSESANFKEYIGAVAEDINKLWEEEAKKYFEVMCNLEFMPATPTLINIGRRSEMLSSCFFFRMEDSLENIFECLAKGAKILKDGGGIGIDFSALRPRGAKVKGTGGTSTGPLSFMKIVSAMGDQVSQGGIRQAAMMASLQVTHPDIMEFITCKKEEGQLANFNISVHVTDEFINAVEADEDFLLQHPCGNKKIVKAKMIWDAIVDNAWRNGEPGIIFDDTVSRGDVYKGKLGKLGTNPCGEILLSNWESCNLAAINLSECYDESKKEIDYAKIDRLTKLGIRFLDNGVDINNYPIPEITEKTLLTRRIGLGITGLHDLFLKKGILYGSDESITCINNIYETINIAAEDQSVELGKIRGIPESLKEIKINRRNAGLLTAQPAGTVSILCNQCSSGIEPVFQWVYKRKDSFGEHMMNHFIVDKFGDDLPVYAKTATEIPWEDHIKVQAAMQRKIDASLSKTINLPNDATHDDVHNAYMLAHKSKCKSLTVYRSGSRDDEVLFKEDKEKSKKESEEIIEKPKLRIRPRVLMGITFVIHTPGGKAFVTINEDVDGLREVFVHISKAGSEVNSYTESTGRLISNSLKHRVPATSLISHLEGHKSTPIFDHGKLIKSVPDAVAKTLKEYIKHWEGFSRDIDIDIVDTEEEVIKKGEMSGEICQDCGEAMYKEGGCETCYSCGYSKCG